MKIVTFITFISCSILTGCLQTEGTLEISGKVLDESTKDAIPFRKAIIKGWCFDDNKLIEVGQFCTDSSGSFSYTMNKAKGAYFYNFSFVGDSSYSFSNQEVPLAELEKNSKFLSFHLSKLSNFIIHIERKTKIPAFDTLYVSWKTDGIEGKSIYPPKIKDFGNHSDIEFRWIGGNVKSVIEAKVLADKKTIICWELFRNGRKKEISDTVYCERNRNSYFNFKY